MLNGYRFRSQVWVGWKTAQSALDLQWREMDKTKGSWHRSWVRDVFYYSFSPSHLLKGTMYMSRSTDQRNWVLCLDYSDEQWKLFSENSISVLYFIGNEDFNANECNRNNHSHLLWVLICMSIFNISLQSAGNFCLHSKGKLRFEHDRKSNVLVWNSQFWRLCPPWH